MPFVRICVTGDEERPTPEQKRELISGVTKLVGDVLGKNTSNMVVIIDEIPMENYGIGGKTVRERRKEQYVSYSLFFSLLHRRHSPNAPVLV